MTDDGFKQMIRYVTAAWPVSETWGDVVWDGWREYLDRYDDDAVKAALHGLRNETYPPRWPDIESAIVAAERRRRRDAAEREFGERFGPA